MFWFDPRSTIGIDVSDHILRAVSINRKGRGSVVRAFASADVPDGAITNGEIQQEGLVKKAIETLFADPRLFPLERVTAVISLPETHGFLKTVLAEASMVEKEIERHLPFPVADVIVDTLDHGLVEQDGKKMRLISFTAIKRTIAETSARLFTESGVHIRALEIESQAIARLFIPSLPANHVAVLVDIGRNHTTFVIVENDHIDLTHSSKRISGEQLTKRIGSAIQLSREDAEQRKLNASLPEVKKIIQQATRDVVLELDRVLTFHREHAVTGDGKQYVIRFTGAGSQLQNLQTMVAEEINLPVEQVTLPTTVTLPPTLQAQFLSYGTAIGLALRDFHPL